MATILVAGLINIETTLRVNGFPLEYNPVNYPFWGVKSTVSGVGYNISKALTVLGHEVRFTALVGQDDLGTQNTLAALDSDHISPDYVLPILKNTPQSVILYDSSGRRQIHVDLKDIQETAYDEARFRTAFNGCALAVLCNINFSRPFLKIAKSAGIPIATDVHTIADLNDAYNRDYMAAADILFMSDESLPQPPQAWAETVMHELNTKIVVIGMGKQGALLALRSTGAISHFPAVQTREVVNTIGAGDALFSAFLHGYLQTRDPHLALQKAMVFASYKIGVSGAADGFLDAASLNQWHKKIYG